MPPRLASAAACLAWAAIYLGGYLVVVATFWLAIAAVGGFWRWATGRGPE